MPQSNNAFILDILKADKDLLDYAYKRLEQFTTDDDLVLTFCTNEGPFQTVTIPFYLAPTYMNNIKETMKSQLEELNYQIQGELKKCK